VAKICLLVGFVLSFWQEITGTMEAGIDCSQEKENSSKVFHVAVWYIVYTNYT